MVEVYHFYNNDFTQTDITKLNLYSSLVNDLFLYLGRCNVSLYSNEILNIMNFLIRQMKLELFLMVVAVILAIAATPVNPITIITPVVAQNMTSLNMTPGEMIAGNISGVFTVTG